jgi:hypothetical protein
LSPPLQAFIRYNKHNNIVFGTTFATILQDPTFYNTLGALGPNPPAFSEHFVRAEEAALGVSFNAQSQVPDIPGISSCAVFFFYEASLKAQSKAPDIQFLSLRVFTEDLLTSFNTKDQVDDPSTQDCRCVPRDLLKSPVPFSQVFARSFFKHIFLHLIFQFASQGSVQELLILNQDSPYQGFWRFEFQVRCFWFRFDIQSVDCVHGVDLSLLGFVSWCS